MLQEAVFQQISPWLDTQPAEIQYPDLKAKLLKEFCPTSSVRTRRILDLPQDPPDDLTPTQLWHEINTLRQLPGLDENGKPKLLDLAKEIWLLCLAPQVRCALSNTDNADIQMLMEEAQQRHEAHTAARRPQSNTFGSSDVSAVHRPRQSSENTPFVKKVSVQRTLFAGTTDDLATTPGSALSTAITSQKTPAPAAHRHRSRCKNRCCNRPTHQRRTHWNSLPYRHWCLLFCVSCFTS